MRTKSKYHKAILILIVIAVGFIMGTLLVINSETKQPASNPNITLTYPTSNSILTSSTTITGQARGMWYFEASFPVLVADQNGKILASTYATAQEDWMTTEFVPFKSVIVFTTTPKTEVGYILLMKDNPSGIEGKNESIRIPVRFK